MVGSLFCADLDIVEIKSIGLCNLKVPFLVAQVQKLTDTMENSWLLCVTTPHRYWPVLVIHCKTCTCWYHHQLIGEVFTHWEDAWDTVVDMRKDFFSFPVCVCGVGVCACHRTTLGVSLYFLPCLRQGSQKPRGDDNKSLGLLGCHGRSNRRQIRLATGLVWSLEILKWRSANVPNSGDIFGNPGTQTSLQSTLMYLLVSSIVLVLAWVFSKQRPQLMALRHKSK